MSQYVLGNLVVASVLFFAFASFDVASSNVIDPFEEQVQLTNETKSDSISSRDSIASKFEIDRRLFNQSQKHALKEQEFQLNDEAVKQIQFDFAPVPPTEKPGPLEAPLEKSWMDFQVDLSVPKSLIDTTKVRKREGYIRLLPYSIWTTFGENPIYDALAFSNIKRLKITMDMNPMEMYEEYGRTVMPVPDNVFNQSPLNSSIVIQNLDFIGFLYNNLNKHGRLLRHNRKYAVAWKTYQLKTAHPESNYAPISSSDTLYDGPRKAAVQPEFYRTYRSLELSDDVSPKYAEHPNHELLQDEDLRTRFGTYTDLSIYASETDTTQLASDRSKVSSSNKKESKEAHKTHKRHKRKKVKTAIPKKVQEPEVLEELPNRMEDLYKYIRMKQEQDSIQRKKMSRKDKVHQNVYEYEQKKRKLDEQLND